MKIGKIKYKKGNTSIEIETAICDCGGSMNFIGSAGCSHDSDYTYFLQCETCKRVETTAYLAQAYRNSYMNMKESGWNIVKSHRA